MNVNKNTDFFLIEGEILELSEVYISDNLIQKIENSISHNFGFFENKVNLVRLVLSLNQIKKSYVNEIRYEQEETIKINHPILKLHDFLKIQEKILAKNRKKRIKDKNILFYDIPFIFLPGKDIIIEDETKNALKIESTPVLKKSLGGQYYEISCYYFEFYNDKFYKTNKIRFIEFFKDFKNINDLIIKFVSAKFKKELIIRGKKYFDLAKNYHVLQNINHAFEDTNFSTIKVIDNSRCIIDFHAFELINPDSDRISSHYEENCSKIISEDNFYLFPGVVPGYSLSKRRWLHYKIDSLSQIQWKNGIIDKLVLDNQIKKLLISFVSEQKNEKFSDFIEGKGGGSIFLLSGPTGTGKTLTAEVISEEKHLPLLKVSLQNLGIRADILETNLEKIFILAKLWNAAILLDEADVFLEERHQNNLERNAIVAAFLRHLEYFDGIAFLTTNNENNIDSAVLSRISLPIKFIEFNNEEKKEVWKILLKEAEIDIDDKTINYLYSLKLHGNGRQIKNIIRGAIKIAKHENRKPTIEDFKILYNYFSKFLDKK